MNKRTAALIGSMVFTATTGTALACPSDCDRNGIVNVDELIQSVQIGLGDAPLSGCAAADADDDGEVRVSDLISGVRSALEGCPDDGLVVALSTGGRVRGLRQDGVRRFLGIPFAQPPVGQLRWQAPRPVEAWEGTLETKAFGPACPQNSSLQGPASDNEDCLHLNVWVPEVATDQLLPVMFWIHGGGNSVGATRDQIPFIGGDFYNGQGLSQTGGVIVVSTNYRLGVFGFFTHEELSTVGDQPLAGNQGLLDQRLALEWVRDNIGRFGGDPDNVTIFGESAGSWNVCYHMLSPGSRGLFHKAIGQSGGCSTAQPTAAEGAEEAGQLAAATGCDSVGATELQCLRSRSVSEILDAAGSGGFNVVVDGSVIPDQPRHLFDSGAFADVPYILGSNRDEGTLFALGSPEITTVEQFLSALAPIVGERGDEVLALYPAEDFPTINDALLRAQGDGFLVCPTYDVAYRAAMAGTPVYTYNFNRPIPIPGLEGLGATHGAEIAYVFGSANPASIPADDLALSEAMRRYWSRFATTGNPNGGSDPEWPRYDPDLDLRINFDTEISIVEDFRVPQCQFWQSIYDEDF